MDFDNPSYFSISNEGNTCENKETWSNPEYSFIKQMTPPRGGSWYKERRMYLRSVSTNSADSNQELLILGEPRLNDIAPDISLKEPTSRSSSVKSHKTDFCNDLSYLPTSLAEEPNDGSSENEVFDSENVERYHNFTAINRTNQRRHSISTFAVRANDKSLKVNDQSARSPSKPTKDFVQKDDLNVDMDDHSIRHASFPRKRCIMCTKGSTKNINMDDILIISLGTSDAASLWVEYFSNYFQQISKHANRKPFRIQCVSLEDIATKSEQEHKEFVLRASSVKLQLVVMCPNFLDLLAERSEDCSLLSKILLTDRTLALLLGITDDDFTDVHKKVIPSYFQWHRKCVGQDQDENFTKEFLGHAMAILSKVWKQQISIISQEKSYFSITPKKIRHGQNSVLVILTYPLQKEDIVKISVEKNGELFEIANVKRRNPYIMKFWMPESLTEVTAIVNILVEKNGSIIGSRPMKCESRLRELEEILRSVNNPIDYMCQAVGFSPAEREHIDNLLVHNFQKNLPPHFNLLANCEPRHVTALQGQKRSLEEFPTLLHFAAKFGLEKLAMQLLECPGADVAYDIRNIYDLTPLELAETNGFTELATMLRGFININEFTSMYAKLMEMSLHPKHEDKDTDGYLVPKSIQQFYKLCPAPRPVVKDTNLPSPSNRPNEWPSNLEYMTMHTPVSITKEQHSPTDRNNSLNKEEHLVPKEHVDLVQKNLKLTNKKSDEVEDRVQKELVEIITDFKNNIHSITQAEKLVEEWKNRNDVQKSFKEKQEQLMEMRIRYEQIQNKMKSAMKKPTPFERMKKLFSKHKHDNTHKISSICSNSDSSSLNNRPIRSLSTSSSGSSGRISTISACSLGDSGTLSDNEDRTLMLGKNSEEELRNNLNKAVLELNYNTLPTPSPVKKLPVEHSYELIEETSLMNLGHVDLTNEFYIQYPPSGLPIPGFEDVHRKDVRLINEYTNIEIFTPTSDTHEYMNFKVPTFSKPL